MILAVTKRDLLPDTVSHEKIAHFIFRRLKEEGTQIRDLVLTSSVQNEGMDELLSLIRQYRKDRPVIVIGKANSGKSTLLNRLAGDSVLTASRYPGTTLDFNEITIDGITFIDTPGIEISQSILMETNEKDLKKILPARTVKPQIFQLKNDQSFAVGGLARVDVLGCTKATAVWYCSDALPIHRGKAENADVYWDKHYGEDLVPVPLHNQFRQYAKRKDEDKMDVVIDGLGWVCLSGDIRTVKVHVPKNVNVTFRKAMI
jgi:ribosome biogenesis GTPase A